MPSINLLDEARRLIRFNTVTTQSNAECAVYAGQLMQRVGLAVEYQEFRQDGQLFLNVIGRLGDAAQRPLLLAAHLDTVSAGDPALWTKTGRDPWRAVVRGDALYGLGSADDKLDFLCKLMAAAQVDASSLKRPLMLVGTFGEERGLFGAARLCQGEFPKPFMALVGEPSQLQLITRHKGLLVQELILPRRGVYRTESAQPAYELEVRGVAAHSSAPHLGENAVTRLLDLMTEAHARVKGLRVLALEGGTAANIIPQRCTALVTCPPARGRLFAARRGVTVRPRRLPAGWHATLPWQDLVTYVTRLPDALAPFAKTRDAAFTPPTMTSVVTQVRVLKGALTATMDVRCLPGQDLNRVAARCEQLGVKLFGHPGDRWQFRRERQNPPLDTPSTAPVVRLMRSAMRAARVPGTIAAKSGCSEAGWYQMVGIPSIVFGPGQAQGNIHQPNERNSLRQIRRAIAVYRAAIERACGAGARP